jgi:hypothetical protein
MMSRQAMKRGMDAERAVAATPFRRASMPGGRYSEVSAR